MSCLPFCLAAALCALPSLMAKSAITHEDVFLMKRVGAPVPSPDGKWVVFPVTAPAYEEKDQTADLWIVPADGSAPPRRLTFTKSPESGPAWSPDSRRLAFSAKREGDDASQIYILDVTGGGEAWRLTSLSTGATAPVWRPDGKAVAFESSVYPGASDDAANKKAAEERKARKYRARVYETFPIRHWDHWLEGKQVHLFAQEIENGKPKDLLAGTRLAAAPGFGGAPSLSGEELQAVWAPDGQSLVFVATTNRTAAAFEHGRTHLYQAPVSGGEPKPLTSGDARYARPAFRPDGKALYCRYEPVNDKVYNLERLAMFAWPAPGERIIVTTSFDRSVNTYAFAPDSRTVYLLAEDAGLEKLYSVPATGGAVREAGKSSEGALTNLAAPARAAFLVANWESAVNPGEAVRIDPGSGARRALSDFNAQRAASIDWLRALRRAKSIRCWFCCTADRTACGATSFSRGGITTCSPRPATWFF